MTVTRERSAGGTQTAGRFTDLRYPSTEPSFRKWYEGNEAAFGTVRKLDEAAWVEPVVKRLNELARLGKDWDPRGSEPVTYEDAKAVADFLNACMAYDSPAPVITPLPSGGLELSWEVGGIELEVVFDSANNERSAILDVNGEETELSPEEAAQCADFLRSPALATG